MDPRGQLESWKEIAAFFNRDERTVKRWEKDRGLPVHRFPGTKGRVYAYPEELTAWRDAARKSEPPPAVAEPAAPTPPEQAEPEGTAQPASEMRPRPWAVAATVVVLCSGAIGMTWGLVRAGYNPPHRQAKPEAEAFYLKGRFYWNQRTPDGLTQALEYFQRSARQDPEYAEAHAGLADTYNLIREYTPMPPSEAYPKAIAEARQAIQLDDRLADGHRALAFALFYGNLDIAGAEREFRRALQLSPGVALTHHWFATCLMTLSRFREALEQIELAQKLDPASRSILSDQALILWHLGRRDQAVTQLKQLETTDTNFVSPHRYLSYIFLTERNYAEYLAEVKQAESLAHNESGIALAESAEKALARGGAHAMLEEILASRKKLFARGDCSPADVAVAYALLGKKSEALEYLKKGLESHDLNLLYLRLEPAFYCLEDQPEYQALLKQIGIP